MYLPGNPRLYRAAASLFGVAVLLFPCESPAGGPKYVAGVSYFNPGVLGQPVHWSGGAVRYFVDQGPLNAQLSSQQAVAMVDAAAALWSAVPTAGVTLTRSGWLNEDVSGASVVPGNAVFAQPSDVTPSATAYPLAVVFDADGSVINSIFGAGAADPISCQNDGVFVWIDNIQPDATIAHAVIALNGLCATTPNLIAMMSFELERAFGRILGLDSSQVNPGALQNGEPGGTLGWPIMQPFTGVCGPSGGNCIPNPGVLRYDDIAALNRIYPITASNLAVFPGKQLTAANTVSVQGTISFRDGSGMQGVNVVARPLDAAGNPLYQYTVTFVSGAYFNGKHGSPVTGFTDANGNPLSMWGSSDPALQGHFDLGGMPLPPGVTSATYQVTFEPINPAYMLTESVGPYVDGNPSPSGTMPVLTFPGLAAGSTQTLTVSIPDSASGGAQDAVAAESLPRPLPPGGMWTGRISQVGQTDWFLFPIRGGRSFTVVTVALNEKGQPTETKALPAIGLWNTFDPVGNSSLGFAPGLNGYATGETWLQAGTSADAVVRLGIADTRGDGRSDYAYTGWILYADTVQPQRLPASGGPIVIQGTGFHPSDTVLVDGHPAIVTSISPNEITAIAPAAAPGKTGSVDVEVDDLKIYYAQAVIAGGVSYDSATGDALTLVTAPANTVPIGVPLPFTVTALGSGMAPAGGVTVTYAVSAGTARLACGQPTCAVTASGDGFATLNITASDCTPSIITASLTNGSSLQAHFTGGTPPVLSALTPTLSVAAGVTVNWTAQALVLDNNGQPVAGQTVTWKPGSGITAQSGASTLSTSDGNAAKVLTIGPFSEGQQSVAPACLNGTTQCVNFIVTGARPEYAYLQPVSGASQSLSVSATPSLIVLRLRDTSGNPLAGGTVNLYQAVYAWSPPCPPQGQCAAAELLTAQASTAISAIDGTVTFIPASVPAVPTSTLALATTGNNSTLTIAIEKHP